MERNRITFSNIQPTFPVRYFLSNPLRVFTVAAATYLFLSLLVTYYFIAHYPRGITGNLIFDDAYYYLGVAQNIARGKGSSFGAVVQTNGYHPLWLFVLAAVMYLGSIQKMWAFASMLTLIYLVKSFSLIKLGTSKSPQALPLVLSAAVVVLQFPGIFSQGLETCLLLLCLPLLAQLTDFPEYFSLNACLKYSAIFIFFFLVRLDLLSVTAAFSILSCLNIAKGKKGIVQNLIVTLLITSAAASIYFLLNFKLFGVIVPISGLNKSVGNKIGENYPLILDYLLAGRFALIALALDFVLIRSARGTSIDTSLFSNELKLVLISGVIVSTYYALFSGWPLWSWYYWPIALLELYSIAKLFHLSVTERRRYRRSRRLNALLYFSWFFLAYVAFLGAKTEFGSNVFRTIVGYHVKKKQYTPPENWTAMNIKVIEDFFGTAPSGIVAMGDRAGGLGFWLPERFKFFQTEGLVADKSYLMARKSGTALDYLKKIGVKYYVVERERIFAGRLKDGTQVHGIVEPIQGMSAHAGYAFICLPEDSILYSYFYDDQLRYIYDFTKVTDCPADMNAQMSIMADHYGELRKYSLPSEYRKESFFKQYILNPH